jgi:hypothetical protein
VFPLGRFPTPPSEPAVQVSLQRALHPLVNLSQKTGESLHFTVIQGTSSLLAFGYSALDFPTGCHPSPCSRLSLPQTTMMAPTLRHDIGGLLTFAFMSEPPTFTLIDSTNSRRRWLMTDPSRSLRNPDRE